MSTLTIRNLDDDLKARLRVRAAQNGRSMEAEVREILRELLAQPPQPGLGTRIHMEFAALGGAELDIPPRTDRPRIIEFDQ